MQAVALKVVDHVRTAVHESGWPGVTVGSAIALTGEPYAPSDVVTASVDVARAGRVSEDLPLLVGRMVVALMPISERTHLAEGPFLLLGVAPLEDGHGYTHILGMRS